MAACPLCVKDATFEMARGLRAITSNASPIKVKVRVVVTSLARGAVSSFGFFLGSFLCVFFVKSCGNIYALGS